jgi:acetyl esterase/lipase
VWAQSALRNGATTLTVIVTLAGTDVRAADYHDITCPMTEAPRAAVVYVHGGGFLIGGTDSWLRERCEPFASAGYLTTAVDYPIAELDPHAPPFSYRRTLRDVIRAVGCLAETGLPVFAYGESVGGNLAEMLAVRDRVAGAVAVGAPASMLTWARHNRAYWRLLGMSRAERREASPLHRIGPNPRPLLLLHSRADEVVPFGESRRLERVLPGTRLIRLSGGHLEDPKALRIGLRWLGRRSGRREATSSKPPGAACRP